MSTLCHDGFSNPHRLKMIDLIDLSRGHALIIETNSLMDELCPVPVMTGRVAAERRRITDVQSWVGDFEGKVEGEQAYGLVLGVTCRN